MGADFLIAICPYNDDLEAVLARIEAIDERLAFRIADDDIGRDEFKTLAEAVTNTKVRLVDAAYEIISDRRDMSWLDLDGRRYFVSGGLSSGDSPTEAFDFINLLDRAGVMIGPDEVT